MVALDIENRAQQMFWEQSESWTGHRWNWDEASAEVKEKFRKHVINNTRPLSKGIVPKPNEEEDPCWSESKRRISSPG